MRPGIETKRVRQIGGKQRCAVGIADCGVDADAYTHAHTKTHGDSHAGTYACTNS